MAVDTTLCVEWKEVKALSPLSAARPLPRLLRQASFDSQDFLQVPPSLALPGQGACAGTAQQGTHPGHGRERDGLRCPSVPAVRLSLLSVCPCQLAASSRAALTSAASRAVSWEKSVHGASLPWQCNLLRASKSCIASPVAAGSGAGVAGTGNGDVQWDVVQGGFFDRVRAEEPGRGDLAHASV